MKFWTEIHTAFRVARAGTVTRAAEDLGIHRATVNRHIDTLEAELGTRLFLRHRKGYELTELGRDFLQVAGRAHEMLDDFAGRAQIQNAELTGEIVVTTLFPMTLIILPAVLEFRERHPHTRVTLNADTALSRLEQAEAHVAVRVGAKPRHDDYVVQPYCTLEFALYASRAYVDRMGMPEDGDLTGHLIVGRPAPDSPAPFEVWLDRKVSQDQVVLQTSNPIVLEDAIRRGAGIGLMHIPRGNADPDLRQITPPIPECQVLAWLVTHVDLHRTEKVQSMLECLKAVAPKVGG